MGVGAWVAGGTGAVRAGGAPGHPAYTVQPVDKARTGVCSGHVGSSHYWCHKCNQGTHAHPRLLTPPSEWPHSTRWRPLAVAMW